ncbi:N-acetylglucosamine kinase [Spongiivirga citrea]|uniref:N-acetylglucosamine kinase n=1 Tax=Spongiivirga citrea TaxID=1481457 RepID=A0A6M0CKH2_9FLAO|nr:N-acetylglucosamine kinase [Spongiivirga citrea]NER15917.1 N-acetylglucosamine kinase [Spongiivirga citrea]
MILIADSGSTKTDWIALSANGEELFQTQTLGLNPQVLTREIIKERIINNFELYQHKDEVTDVYFYGAGLGVERPKERINDVFGDFFTKAELHIKEDTYAALYAVFEEGTPCIVCILGTGSNCSYYDGDIVHQKVISLGYILMDDASGNYFGGQMIRDYHFSKMPDHLKEKFGTDYELSAESVKTHLYREPNPNTYLATFARFLIENKDEEYSQQLIKKGLQLFVENQIMQFENCREIPVHFVGSIGFYLEKELRAVLKEYGITPGKIIKAPIEGLVDYHLKNKMHA